MSEEVSIEDAELVKAVQAGDRDAFGQLVERYQDRLFNTVLRILGSREDASDVVQEAFVQAYVKLNSFRGDAKFYTWLYRIAMNRALSTRRDSRRRSRQRGPVVSIEAVKDLAGEEPVDHNPGPDAGLLEGEMVEAVQAALLKLSDEHRQILVLREMEGCCYETIAEILQLPVGTVRSRLFRARVVLKEVLSVEG